MKNKSNNNEPHSPSLKEMVKSIFSFKSIAESESTPVEPPQRNSVRLSPLNSGKESKVPSAPLYSTSPSSSSSTSPFFKAINLSSSSGSSEFNKRKSSSASSTDSVSLSNNGLASEEKQPQRSEISVLYERMLGPSKKARNKEEVPSLQMFQFGTQNDAFSLYNENDFENDRKFYTHQFKMHQ